MGRKRKGPRIIWRKGRAYGDFRAYSDVGGGREALSEPGSSWGTTDEDVAEQLFSDRLQELRENKRGRVVATTRTITLAELIRDHLKKKSKAGKTSITHLDGLEHRLSVAMEFFGRDRDPRTITPDDVRKWTAELAKRRTRSGKPIKPGTVRHYLNALSGLYGRAQEGLYVPPAYNPVAMMQEKPTGHGKAESAFFEVADAALLLEAARRFDNHPRPGKGVRGLYPIVATFLLTGGRRSEVLGLDVEDVSFDRGLIHFRPNRHRGLKTSTSHRSVPLWPQLRPILQEWMYAGDSPRTSGLLFTAYDGGMIGSMRKTLDAIGAACGMDEREVRTRRFRHTYCSARLQTVQRILRPGRQPTDDDAWEYVEVSKFQVQKEMGHGGAQLVDRIYGHAHRNPYRSEVVEYRIDKHRDELGERLRALEAASA